MSRSGWVGLGASSLAIALIAGAGCGGGTHFVHPDRHEELESLEARIEETALELGQVGLACGDRCRGTLAICDAAERICEIAGELRDPDVDARCERARGRCGEARGQIDASCACETDSGGAGEAEPL